MLLQAGAAQVQVWVRGTHAAPALSRAPAVHNRRHVQHRPGHPEIPPNTGNVIRLAANTGARCTWSSRSVSRWTTVCCGAPGSTTTSTPQCGSTHRGRHSSLPARADPGACSPSRRAARRASPTSRGGRATGSSSAPRPPACPPRVREAIPAIGACACRCAPGQRSLNLSNAVAVAVFEAWRQNGYAAVTRPAAATSTRSGGSSGSARSRPISCSSAWAGRDPSFEHADDRLGDRHRRHRARARAAAPSRRSSTPSATWPSSASTCAQRHALGEQQADAPVARQVAGGGQHQVAEAGQPHEGLRPCPERDAEAGHLGEAARHQRGPRVEAELHAVGDARWRSRARS